MPFGSALTESPLCPSRSPELVDAGLDFIWALANADPKALDRMLAEDCVGQAPLTPFEMVGVAGGDLLMLALPLAAHRVTRLVAIHGMVMIEYGGREDPDGGLVILRVEDGLVAEAIVFCASEMAPPPRSGRRTPSAGRHSARR